MLLISYQWFWFLSSIPHSAYEEKKNNSQRFAHWIIFEVNSPWSSASHCTCNFPFWGYALQYFVCIEYTSTAHRAKMEEQVLNFVLVVLLSNTPWSSFLFSKCLSHKNLWSFLSGIYFKLSSTEQQESCVYASSILIKYCSCFCLSPVLNLC